MSLKITNQTSEWNSWTSLFFVLLLGLCLQGFFRSPCPTVFPSIRLTPHCLQWFLPLCPWQLSYGWALMWKEWGSKQLPKNNTIFEYRLNSLTEELCYETSISLTANCTLWTLCSWKGKFSEGWRTNQENKNISLFLFPVEVVSVVSQDLHCMEDPLCNQTHWKP